MLKDSWLGENSAIVYVWGDVQVLDQHQNIGQSTYEDGGKWSKMLVMCKLSVGCHFIT